MVIIGHDNEINAKLARLLFVSKIYLLNRRDIVYLGKDKRLYSISTGLEFTEINSGGQIW